MAGDNHQPVPGKVIVPPVHGPAGPLAPARGARTLAGQFREALKLSRETPDPVVFDEAIARLAGTVEVPGGPLAQWREAADLKAREKNVPDRKK